ncbi:hypothetical protein E4T56_gene6639, partial [Termitomyces sp. T112]
MKTIKNPRQKSSSVSVKDTSPLRFVNRRSNTMVSPTVNVVRYSALAFGVAYGFYHRRTLQEQHDQ